MNYLIARMSHLLRKIPSTICYGFTFSEFPRIAKYILKITDIIPRESALFPKMMVKRWE